MAKITVAVGLPRSGKSTWARSTGAPIVNPDSVRLSLHGHAFIARAEPFVWPIVYCMAQALLLAGHEHIVVDATNISEKRRSEWVSRFPGVEVEFKIFDVSPTECTRRAKLTGREDLVPVIERMAGEWDLPRPPSWGPA